MPEFSYIVRDKNGKKAVGRREADSAEELAEQLQIESLIPLEINPIIISEKQATKSRFVLPDFFEAKVPQKELQMFCRQMYTLLKAGIPIITTVTRLIETTRNKQLVTALTDVLLTLNQGRSLSVGLSLCPKVFSTFFVNLVKVGESSGQLDKTFLYLAEYVELEIETKKKIKTAFRYPKMVSFAILIALLVINTFVIPAFSQLFKSFQGALPLPTLILMATSNFILSYWYILIGVTLIIVVTFRYWVKTPNGMVLWAYFKLKIPIMGWIVHRITLARFAKLFAMVLRAGLTAVEGIELVGASTDDAYFAQKIKVTSELIARGNTIAGAIAQTQLFPPLMIQMIALGEESGNIDTLLDEVADFYQRELIYDLAHLSEAIEPILLVFIAAIVLVLALGVFLPMWNMASQFK
ncbi:MAG: type II secretion system F family protein [Legionellaceae bacterium]|nr:type II secretion system F family protein [Legionellaceae bacterium]